MFSVGVHLKNIYYLYLVDYELITSWKFETLATQRERPIWIEVRLPYISSCCGLQEVQAIVSHVNFT